MILEIGKYATLRVVKEVDFGFYLDGGPFGEILLPKKQAPEGLQPEDTIKVFIYTDSEDRLIATTIQPKATVGELAFLEVVETNEYGAFLDWGIYSKHLFVPFREQRHEMLEDHSYLVYLYLDETTDRVVATTRFDKYFGAIADNFVENQPVSLTVARRTPMGFRVIVNKTTWGMLYQNEIFKPIRIGQNLNGFIKKVREDGKIDVMLQRRGYDNTIDANTKIILDRLRDKKGFLPLTDKSPPELIYEVFGMSKKNFKKAIGHLYKKKKINIGKGGIFLKK